MASFVRRNIAAIRQVLSALAVMLSLIFVGLQIKQNTEAERAATRQALADGSRDVVLAVATNPRLAEAFHQIYRTPDGAGPYFRELTKTDSPVASVLVYGMVRNAADSTAQRADDLMGHGATLSRGVD